MAQPFSLFPRSGVPKLGTPDPHKRQRSLHAVKTFHGEVEGREPLPDGVVIDVQESAASRSRTPSADFIGMAVTTSSPLDKSTPSPLPPPNKSMPYPSTPPPPPAPPKAFSPRSPPSEQSESATLVPGDTRSPVVPFRSMFPTYNPGIPLHQQNYYPQRSFPGRSSSLYSRNVSREEYRNSITTPIDRQLGARTAPPSVIHFNDSVSISELPHFSSHRELEKLWEATHGTEPSMLIKTFDLEMTRTSEATFTFGADPQYPFYTLKTFDTNEISVSKTNPVKRSDIQEIVLSAIEPLARRLPPNDGLVSFIFPKMAAMLALTQSSQIAKSNHLASSEREDIEAAAIRRAAAQEACHLRWNANHDRYELEHPAVARRARDPNFLKSPISPDSNSVMMTQLHDPMLHILITNPALSSPPIITISNPNVTTPNASATAGIRLSTIPQSDSSTPARPLASLDLNKSLLHIDADQILSLMPSLFSIDSIICALFAVAIADESTNPILGSLPIWMPRPKAPLSQYGGSVRSYAGSTFFATLAEREEAEAETKKMGQEHKKDVRESRKAAAANASAKASRKGRQKTWYGARRRSSSTSSCTSESGEEASKRKKSRVKKVTIGEFDLEKLGHYQAGEREGQQLPAPVRVLMETLVAVLRFVTWLLTLIVSAICWVLVKGTRCVTSERF